MNRRVLKNVTLGGLMLMGLSACNGLSGIHMNSQVLQGQRQGVRFEPAQPRAAKAPSDATRQSLSARQTAALAAEAEAAAGPVDAATASVEESRAALIEAAPKTIAKPAPAPKAVAKETRRVSPPVSASAPSFVGQKTTVVGLGDPGRDGLWMETPLVSARRNARLTAPNGKTVVVTLEPISGDEGGGSRLSIGGMRALGLPLTELVEVRVGPV